MAAREAAANPLAWLVAIARNRGIDRIRRRRTLQAKTRELEVRGVTVDELEDTVIEDERPELTLACCHQLGVLFTVVARVMG